MNTTPSFRTQPHTHIHSRALVLGGGGSTGNAWLIGVIAGLFDAGLDVTGADLTVGTSAGSTAAAQLLGTHPGELYRGILHATVPPPRTAPGAPIVNHLDRTAQVIADATDPDDMRRRMGASALELDAAPDHSAPDHSAHDHSAHDHSAQWRAICASRFTARDWPERALLITAVDASTGEPVVFDRRSGVELVDAVAASTSGGLPYRLGDARYIDGGYRTNAENADLAAGRSRVLVLSPFGGRTRLPLEWGLDLATQVAQLRAAGSRVRTVFPLAAAESMFGANGMDLSLRAPAARAGYEQGSALAEELAPFWAARQADL